MPRTWTEEEREEQRQRMLALHEEGRAGGEFGKLGGRPRKKRASEEIANRVSAEAEEYFERMDDIAKNGRNAESLKAIQTLLAVEENERQIEVEEQRHYEELNKTQLIEVVRAQYAELLRRRVIDESGVPVEGGLREISASAGDDS